METMHVEQKFEEFQDAARTALGKAKEQLAPVDSWLRQTTKEHPLAVLAAAIGVGYFVGRLLRR